MVHREESVGERFKYAPVMEEWAEIQNQGRIISITINSLYRVILYEQHFQISERETSGLFQLFERPSAWRNHIVHSSNLCKRGDRRNKRNDDHRFKFDRFSEC